MAGGKTRAIRALDAAGVVYAVHTYDGRTRGDLTYGESVAVELGVEPDRVFKTLIAEVDGSPTVAIVPVAAGLSVRALARAAGGRSARLADEATAERITGYRVGGISPFGQRTRLPVFVDEWVETLATMLVSGGRRGLQVEISPADLVRLTGALVAPIAT